MGSSRGLLSVVKNLIMYFIGFYWILLIPFLIMSSLHPGITTPVVSVPKTQALPAVELIPAKLCSHILSFLFFSLCPCNFCPWITSSFVTGFLGANSFLFLSLWPQKSCGPQASISYTFSVECLTHSRGLTHAA